MSVDLLVVRTVDKVVVVVVGDQIVQGEPVVRGPEVDRRDGPAVVGLVEIRGAGEAQRELPKGGRLAAPEVADGVAVLTVPPHPQRRKTHPPGSRPRRRLT